MKKLLPALCFTLLLTITSFSQTITPLYLNFNSHSEEMDKPFGFNYNSNVDTFNHYRNLLVAMCDTFRAKGAKYNSQHDWAFLDGAKLYDNGTNANTNNKPLFTWMRDDNNGLIELDCHAHKTQKNDADVAWYYEQLGIIPSAVVGGFLYDTVMNVNMPGSNWTDMQDSLPGKAKPFFKFQFDILWGGGTPSHQGGDLNPIGIWRPDTLHNILSNNSSRHLIILGNGCNDLLTDTAANVVSNIANEIRELVYEINNGQLPGGKFYASTIQFNIRDLKPGLPVKAAQLIDSLQPLIDAGYIVWKNHSEKVNIWKTQLAEQVNIVTCSDVPAWNGQTGIVNAIQEFAVDGSQLTVYPNPTSGDLNISVSENFVGEEVSVFDLSGRKTLSTAISTLNIQLPTQNFQNGIYFVKAGNVTTKFVKQ